MCILLIDDNLEFTSVLKKLMVAVGYKDVVVAPTPQQGLEMIKRLRPKVVLCDIQMPGLDGVSLLQHVREDTSIPTPFMVAATGYGNTSEKIYLRQAGFDAHLLKPFYIDEVKKVIGAPK